MKFISKFAIALALGGMAVTPAAYAKSDSKKEKKKKSKKQAKVKLKMSKGFIAAYSPAVNAYYKKKDVAAATALIPSVKAAVANEDDRFEAGNYILNVGIAAKNKELQGQGLDMLIASTTTPADKKPLYLFYKGAFAFDNKDYVEAEAKLTAAHAAGFRNNDISYILANAQAQQRKYSLAQNSLRNAVAEKLAAGQAVPANWYAQGKSIATNQKDTAGATYWASELVKASGSKEAYHDLLVPYAVNGNLTLQERVDVFRLAHETDALLFDHEYTAYLQDGDRKRYPAEALKILQNGSDRGLVNLNNIAYAEAVRDAKSDKAELAKSWDADEKFGLSKSAGYQAMLFGDRVFGFGEYARAASNYKAALEKGNIVGRDGVDLTDQALTRLGIAKMKMGDVAGAKAEWAKITGANRKTIASFWALYADQKAKADAAAAVPAAAPAAS